jgi:DNA-binding MarR family transcriptional regulator
MESGSRKLSRTHNNATAPNAAALKKLSKVEVAAGSHRSSIGFQMRKTYRMIEIFIQSRLARHDIPVGMWYFLRTLWIEDGLTQRELANRVGTTEPTALEQLRKMETRGLVKRRRDEADRRKSTVYLTAQGKRLKNLVLPYVDELNAAAFCDFAGQERKQLEQYLARIRRNLHAAMSR